VLGSLDNNQSKKPNNCLAVDVDSNLKKYKYKDKVYSKSQQFDHCIQLGDLEDEYELLDDIVRFKIKSINSN